MFLLVEGKKWIDQRGRECLYTGEVDQNDKMCGYGIAIPVPQPEIPGDERRRGCRWEGTFFNDKAHGISKSHLKKTLPLFSICSG